MVTESRVPTPAQARARGPQLAGLAALFAALMLTASACGSSGTKTEVLRLRSANPVTSDLYVRMKGPAGAVSFIAKRLTTGGFSKGAEGFFLPPRLRQEKTCSLRHNISDADAPELQAWRGRRMTLTVYGDSNYAATYCRGISVGIYAPRS